MRDFPTVILTGATGYVGSLIAAALLTREEVGLVLPVREGHIQERTLALLRAVVEAQGESFRPEFASRIELVTSGDEEALASICARRQVCEIVHCAGCLDYFDTETLEKVNIGLTDWYLTMARRWKIPKFIYISTAFSSGYTQAPIPEVVPHNPGEDPTEYVRTKRAAEWLVHTSGVPYQILRPSIIIGDSRDGHYIGKAYGLYQLWNACRRILCKQWQDVYHLVAPREELNLVHQDAFQDAFLGARRLLPDNTVLNLVSHPDPLLTTRDLWDQWIETCFQPCTVNYYRDMNQLPRGSLPRNQRALLALASVNIEISSFPWKFERTNLDQLVQQGVKFRDATLESVSRCLDVFMRGSEQVQKYLAAHRDKFPAERTVIEHYNSEPVAIVVGTRRDTSAVG